MSARTRESWAAATDIGRVRTHNEDSMLAQPPLFVVADGLGGHEAGEVASSIAVETLRDHAPRHADSKALARAVKAANREVLRASREGVGRAGMGTTITAALVEGCHIAIAHVGDSRAYLLHDGQLQRLTEDHSMVADMIRLGQLTEAESRVHPNRSVITRALGTDASMEADTYDYDSSQGDRLLLCSDGLTSMLVDDRIRDFLGRYKDPEVTAKALVQAANDEGGQDNITVVIVEIEGEETTVKREQQAARRTWLAVLAWVLAFVLVVAGIGYGVYRYARDSYFLIADQGVVVVYQGVPGELAGYSLKWEITRTTTLVEALPPATQSRLAEGVTASSLAEALRLAGSYRDLAEPPVDDSAPAGTGDATDGGN